MKSPLVTVMVTFGTRPEALKLAPLIDELRRRPEIFDAKVCVTAQHRQMLDQVLELFSIKPDVDLNLMEQDQSLARFASRALIALDRLFSEKKPHLVVVQGDTTTTLAAALAGFYNGAEIAHVEAGLRSFNKHAPFPEEVNRQLTSHLADLHFAPTERGRNNLLREGIEPDRIVVTGNTIVDTLQQIVQRLNSGSLSAPLRECFAQLPARFVLVTVHRRENHGANLLEICGAVRKLNDLVPNLHTFFPIHLHPNVQKPVREVLAGLPRVHLLPPLDYTSFVWLMQQSELVLSDSGGVQEECCALGKQVLVMREVTERYEAIEAGVARLVGCDNGRIVTAALETLGGGMEPKLEAVNPFGDGKAARRIAAALASRAHTMLGRDNHEAAAPSQATR